MRILFDHWVRGSERRSRQRAAAATACARLLVSEQLFIHCIEARTSLGINIGNRHKLFAPNLHNSYDSAKLYTTKCWTRDVTLPNHSLEPLFMALDSNVVAGANISVLPSFLHTFHCDAFKRS